MAGATFATGGSATSQADASRTWTARPVVAWSLRLLAWLTPIVASFLAARVYGLLVSADVIGWPAFWGGLLLITVSIALAVQHRMQSLMPLVALFNMSLVFPDQAPSRFGVALRGRTANKLHASADEQGDGDPATELLGLVKALGQHDPLTRGHSERVRAYADLIGQEMGLSQSDRDRLAWGALAHDVGKLDVRPSTLNKKGRPDADEWEEIRGHPGAAVHRMEPLEDWLGDWALAASQHHERWDGNGYPLGLKGEEISLAGRIVAVADAYDVMTSARSYKPALSAEAARSELINNAETQFDPAVVRAFLQVGLKPVRAAGPLAWLSEFAWFARVPQAASVATSSAASTAATAAVSIATVVASPLTPTDADLPERYEVSIERTVDSDDVDDAGPDDPIAIVVDTTTTTTTADASSSTTTTVTVTTTAAPVTTTEPPGDVASTSTTTSPAVVPTTTTTTAPPVDSTTTTTTSPSTAPATPPTTTVATPPASTTIAPTTTTEPVMYAFASPVYLESRVGGADTFSFLDGKLSDGALPNYDQDRDDDPGLLLKKGDGIGEIDPAKRHRFWAPTNGGVLLGVPEVEIWVSTKDHTIDKTGVVIASLEDCSASKADCTTIATGTAAFDQADFGTEFGRLRISMTALDHELGPARSIMLNLFVHDGSEDDLWFAYGTTEYPGSFTMVQG